MANSQFSFTSINLENIAQKTLEIAQKAGASACELDVSESLGQSVGIRLSEVETIEYNQDKGLSITTYIGHKKGHASTTDLSDQAITDTVLAAINIAKYTGEDPCSGLADAHRMAHHFVDLDLYKPWNINVDEAILIAKECEEAAFAVDPRINNADGATLNSHVSRFIYANSHGFINGFKSSQHSLSTAVIAEGENTMQRDYWYASARHPEDLLSAQTIGKIAGERTIRRLNAKRIKTGTYPVLFEAPVATSLIGHFVSAVSGGSLYRKSSFLLDSLNQAIFSPLVNIKEDPFVSRGTGSSCFDNEGVATQARQLVENGILNGYFLGSYSARKLGMESTGNAGGVHNLLIKNTGESFDELVKKMGTGLIVTELMGQGINGVTGDYSRGAAGFWVENGVISYPVEEITIASNLKDMFKRIEAIGADELKRGSISCGSILLEQMAIAGE